MKRLILAGALLAAPAAMAQTGTQEKAGTTPAPTTTPTAGRPAPGVPTMTTILPRSAGPALPGAARVARQTSATGTSRNAPVNGVLTLYGNERCPTNENGEEIVVCVRRSAAEQFRIPKELRTFEVTPENASWAAKAQGTLDEGVGVASVGSCSTVGAGGATGCQVRMNRAGKKDAQARAKAQEIDLP